MTPVNGNQGATEKLSAEVHRLWPGFWQFLVALDRLVESTEVLKQTSFVEPVAEPATVRPATTPAGPSVARDKFTAKSEIAACADGARIEFLATWGDLVRGYATELTEKEWTVASLCYHHGFSPAQIAEYYRQLGQPRTPQSVKAVYALLQRAKRRCLSGARRERESSKFRAKKDAE